MDIWVDAMRVVLLVSKAEAVVSIVCLRVCYPIAARSGLPCNSVFRSLVFGPPFWTSVPAE